MANTELVFISAKSGDYGHARRVHAFLSKNGVPTFFADATLDELGASEFSSAINAKLEEASHLVVVASSRANVDSRWVRYEWETFHNEKLAGRKTGNLLTVTVDLDPGELPIELRQRQVFALKEESLLRLLNYVREVRKRRGGVGKEVASAARAHPKVSGAFDRSVTIELGRDVSMKFILVPSGKFRMGAEDSKASERPVREVRVARPFYLAATEVTQAQWKAVTREDPSDVKGDDLPVVNVSWVDCQDFLARLSKKVGGAKFTLPSEAEWEYACRAGTTTRYWSGSEEVDLARVGWYRVNSKRRTHAAGEMAANPWGLFDMHGNVWEWCEDEWHDSYKGGPTDGSAWVDKGSGPRVFRGGGFASPAEDARSACRGGSHPNARFDFLGFRPARSATSH